MTQPTTNSQQEPSFDRIPMAIAELTDKVDSLMEKLDTIISQGAQPDMNEMIGIDEACKIVNLERSTIYARAHAGTIPCYKPGKKLMFKRGELLEWVQNYRRKEKARSKSEIIAQMQKGLKHKPRTAKRP